MTTKDKDVTYILEDPEWNCWECSGCGLLWVLSNGGPKDNEMNYCPKCGRRISAEEWGRGEHDLV